MYNDGYSPYAYPPPPPSAFGSPLPDPAYYPPPVDPSYYGGGYYPTDPYSYAAPPPPPPYAPPPPAYPTPPPVAPSRSGYSPSSLGFGPAPPGLRAPPIKTPPPSSTPPSAKPVFNGTIWPAREFQPERDAERLRKAMKGLGCDRSAVVAVLCARNNAQRQSIAIAYKQMHGRDLFKDLLSELGGNLEEVMAGLMYPPAAYDAVQLRKAVKGLGTNEATLIEIMCSRSNAEIAAAKKNYRAMFSRDLEQDLISDTSFNFRRLMVSLCQGARDESGRVNVAQARNDAQRLYQAGEKRLGTDESTFNVIIAAQGYNQLRLVFDEYEKLAGRTLEASIGREFSGSIRDGLLAVVACVRSRPGYFAHRLYLSMKGLGTNDTALVRIIVSRSEVDLALIKKEFNRRYPKTLSAMIAEDTSGKYKDALLTLVRGNR